MGCNHLTSRKSTKYRDRRAQPPCYTCLKEENVRLKKELGKYKAAFSAAMSAIKAVVNADAASDEDDGLLVCLATSLAATVLDAYRKSGLWNE